MTGELARADTDLREAPFTWRTLQYIADTEFVPEALRGRPAAMLAAVITGRELGVAPMMALQEIDLIKGRPTPSASLLAALVRRAGHRIRPGTITDESAEAIGERLADGKVTESYTYVYTRAMAERAGLLGKAVWSAYPEAMLYWRAVTMVARMMFSDVIANLKYTPEELGDENWHAEVDAIGVPDNGSPVVSDTVDWPAEWERYSADSNVRQLAQLLDQAGDHHARDDVMAQALRMEAAGDLRHNQFELLSRYRASFTDDTAGGEVSHAASVESEGELF